MSQSLKQIRAAQALDLFERQVAKCPRFADERRLLRHAFSVCSQNGEDGMIQEVFTRIGAVDRTFVEVGVGDGTENNTAFLLSQGWKGFWIDGDKSFENTLSRRHDLPEGVLKSARSFVSRENIAGALESLGVPTSFDFLSLDIDQNTYYLWEGLGAFRPRVVVVEYNASIPAEVDWKVRYDPGRFWDGSHNFGASLKAFEGLGRRLGYSLVGCDINGVNAFFVRDDCLGDKFAAPYTAQNHYEPPRYALMQNKGHRTSLLDRVEAESSERKP